jgi:hypothetical protein
VVIDTEHVKHYALHAVQTEFIIVYPVKHWTLKIQFVKDKSWVEIQDKQAVVFIHLTQGETHGIHK